MALANFLNCSELWFKHAMTLWQLGVCPEIPAWLNRRRDVIGPLASLLSETMGWYIRIRKGMKSNVNVALPPRGTAWIGFPASGCLLTRLPIMFFHDSGSSGFRSLHGCGAAGASNPSSTHPSVFFCYLIDQ